MEYETTLRLISDLVEALDQFYNQGNSKVNDYLEQFQKSLQAWGITDYILSNYKLYPEYVIFFAAQTLHTKIRIAFHEIPESEWLSSRNSILNHIRQHAGGRTNLRTQLCLAASSFAVQMNSWNNVVGSIASSFEDNRLGNMCVLEILRVLPEEIYDPNVHVNEHRRDEIRTECNNSAPHVLAKLESIVMNYANGSNDVEMVKLVLLCLQSWIRSCNIDEEIVAKNQVLKLLAIFAKEANLFEVVVDTFVELFRQYGYRYQKIAEVLAPEAMKLKDDLLKAIEEEDADSCIDLCRVFTEMSEAYVELIFSSQIFSHLPVIDLLVYCMSFPDHEVAEITINFWFEFTDCLRNMTPESEKATQINRFKSSLLRLSSACMSSLQFSGDFQCLAEDKQQDFKNFRQDLGDILRNCCRLLGTSHILSRCIDELEIVLNQPSATLNSWKQAEAYLYTIRSIAREIGASETNDLPRLFGLFDRLPDHPAIHYTSTLIIHRYSKWICSQSQLKHASYQLILGYLQRYTSDSQENAQWNISCAASTAIRSMCQDCPKEIGETVYQFYVQLCSSPGQMNMAVGDQIVILEGVCTAISILHKNGELSIDQYSLLLEPLIRPLLLRLVTHLQQLSNQLISVNSTASAFQDILAQLRCIFEFAVVECSTKQPLLEYAKELVPSFKYSLIVYGKIGDVVEDICRCYKRIIRNCKLFFVPLIPDLYDQLCEGYDANPLSSYLYCTSVCISDFRDINNAEPELLNRTIVRLSSRTTCLLGSLNDFTEYPDIVEEYYFMIERCLRYFTVHVVSNQPLLDSITKGLIHGIAIHHSRASRSILSCLETLIQLRMDNRFALAITATLDPSIPNLLQSVVYCILGQVPFNLLRLDSDYACFAKILFLLFEQIPEYCKQKVHEILQNQPAPDAAAIYNTLITSRDWDSFKPCVRRLAIAKNLN